MVSFVVHKINISHSLSNNILIIFVFILLTLIFQRKDEPSDPLSSIQTTQIRGLAMLFIVLGHLWTHVSATPVWPNFAGISVNFFLFISGFGLTTSYCLHEKTIISFMKNRIRRVMIPYWIATFLIIALDIVIVGNTLGINDLIMTFAGVNLNISTQRFDYVRWYITFQLVWYLLFIFLFRYFSSRLALIFLLVIAFILFVSDYYIFHFGWSHFFAFPIGCFVAVQKDFILSVLKEHSWILKFSFVLIGIHLSISYAFHENFILLPSIVLRFIYEINSLIWTFALIFIAGLFGQSGYISRFLLFIGTYSYEIFLLHGPFLVKYNFIITTDYGFPIIFTFLLFLVFVLIISIIVNRVNDYVIQ